MEQPGVIMAGILKRLETWAADSPERHRLLVVIVCLGLGMLVLLFIVVMAWFALVPGDTPEPPA